MSGPRLGKGDRPRPSDRRPLFVKELLSDPKRNAKAAAIRAGYAPRSAETSAGNLLRNAWVQGEIARLDAPRLNRLDVTAERVIHELAALGFADMADYVDFSTDGAPTINLRTMPEGATKAIMEVTQETTWVGKGEDASPRTVTKLKLHPKTPALELLARYLGILVQRHEVSGPDGAAIPIDGNVRIYFELPDNGRGHAITAVPLLGGGV